MTTLTWVVLWIWVAAAIINAIASIINRRTARLLASARAAQEARDAALVRRSMWDPLPAEDRITWPPGSERAWVNDGAGICNTGSGLHCVCEFGGSGCNVDHALQRQLARRAP